MERPIIKDKQILAYVEMLEQRFKTPYYNSYQACKSTLDRWNKQISEKEVDLFDAEDKSKFDMIHKYLTEQKPYLEQLEYLLSKMTPEEKEATVKTVAGSTAEAHIFVGK